MANYHYRAHNLTALPQPTSGDNSNKFTYIPAESGWEMVYLTKKYYYTAISGDDIGDVGSDDSWSYVENTMPVVAWEIADGKAMPVLFFQALFDQIGDEAPWGLRHPHNTTVYVHDEGVTYGSVDEWIDHVEREEKNEDDEPMLPSLEKWRFDTKLKPYKNKIGENDEQSSL